MGEWLPIESAPRDGTKILIWADAYSGQVIIARWDDDKYAKKPIPRWVTNDPVYGRRTLVDNPPHWWQPLPVAP